MIVNNVNSWLRKIFTQFMYVHYDPIASTFITLTFLSKSWSIIKGWLDFLTPCGLECSECDPVLNIFTLSCLLFCESRLNLIFETLPDYWMFQNHLDLNTWKSVWNWGKITDGVRLDLCMRSIYNFNLWSYIHFPFLSASYHVLLTEWTLQMEFI
jgi:hypothetical protein